MNEAKSYSEKLRDPRWQRVRLKVFEYSDFRCQVCGGADKTLNVHHSYYEDGKEPWDYPIGSMISACEECHEKISQFLGHTEKEDPDKPSEPDFIKVPERERWLAIIVYHFPELRQQAKCLLNAMTHPIAKRVVQRICEGDDGLDIDTEMLSDRFTEEMRKRIENPDIQVQDLGVRILAAKIDAIISGIIAVSKQHHDMLSDSERISVLRLIQGLRNARNKPMSLEKRAALLDYFTILYEAALNSDIPFDGFNLTNEMMNL